MQQLPDDISHDDMAQWLSRGFFYVSNDGDASLTLVSLVEIQGGGSTHLYVVALGTTDPFVVSRDKVWTHWPVCGAINTPLGALYVQRFVERQWRRVYSGRHVSVDVPWRWEAVRRRPALGNLNGDSLPVVQALFNPQYPDSVAECMDIVSGAKAPGTVALNRLIILDASGGVYYHGNQVGTLDLNERLVPTCGERLARRLEKYIEGGLAL